MNESAYKNTNVPKAVRRGLAISTETLVWDLQLLTRSHSTIKICAILLNDVTPINTVKNK